MVKPGDTVRYLNAVGGGIVRRVENGIAYVDDEGFETPVAVREVVVVLPAGHEPAKSGAKLMFDQVAFDEGKKAVRTPKTPSKEIVSEPQRPLPPAPETKYGNRLFVSLAFEPSNLKDLAKSEFNAVLVNDSNYTLQFCLAGRLPESALWEVIYQGDVQPNELIDLGVFTHVTLGSIERIVLQAIAFKEGKEYEVKEPINVMRKLDLTKFHKLHCFRPGRYFDSDVLEFPLVDSDRTTRQTL